MVGGGDLYCDLGIFYDLIVFCDRFFVVQFFVGVLGISEYGIFEQYLLLVCLIDEMSSVVLEVILLVDSWKFNVCLFIVLLLFLCILCVVIDYGLLDVYVCMLECVGVEIVIVWIERE